MDYVCGFLFSEDKQYVALIEKTKPLWQEGLWNGIGGKIDRHMVIHYYGEPLESPKIAMSREFNEEADVIIYPDEWKLFHETTNINGEKCHFFKAFSDLVFDAYTASNEEVKIFMIYDLLSSMEIVYNLRWLIPMALDYNHVFSRSENNIPIN